MKAFAILLLFCIFQAHYCHIFIFQKGDGRFLNLPSNKKHFQPKTETSEILDNSVKIFHLTELLDFLSQSDGKFLSLSSTKNGLEPEPEDTDKAENGINIYHVAELFDSRKNQRQIE